MSDKTKVYDSPAQPGASGDQPNTVKVFEAKKSSLAWLWWMLIPLLLLIGFLVWYFNRNPDTAPRAAAPVTQTTEAAAPTGTTNMGAVYFALGSSELSPDAQQALNGAVAQMKQDPNMRLGVKGYTDSTGDQATNVALSKQRAGVVQHYLNEQGISNSRMDVKGFGEAPSAQDGTGPEQNNRRVELFKE